MKANRWMTSLLAIPALLTLPGSATAQTRSVETTVYVDAAPERVLQAFMDPSDLEGWWQVTRSLVEAKPGGTWSVAWDDYGEERTHHVWTGVVQEVEPRRLLIGHLVMIEPDRPIFAPLYLEIVASPQDGGTRLTVSHRGYRSGEQWDWMHDTVVAGWQHVLGEMQKWFELGEDR